MSLTMNLPSDFLVTVFPNAVDTTAGETGSIAAVIEIIRSPALAPQTTWIRECRQNNDPTAEDAKRQLPVIVWSGIFTARNNGSCTTYHGTMPLDLDDLENAEEVRDRLAGDPHIICCFRSPGGNGCKPVIWTDAKSPAEHYAAWVTACRYLKDAYDLTVSGGQGDVSRACFAAHDPDAWINPNAVPLPVDRTITRSAPVASASSAERISRDRHPYLVAYCARLARAGLGSTEIRAAAEALIRDRFDLSDGRVFSDREIDDAIDSGCAKFKGADETAAIVHGAKVAAALIANAEHTQVAPREQDPGPIPEHMCSLPGIGGIWINHCLARGVLPQPELALGAVLAALSLIHI